MRDFFKKLVAEGSRVFWTAVEALAGFLAAYNVPESLLDGLGQFEVPALMAIGTIVAAAAAKLKEVVRLKQNTPTQRAAVEKKV